MSPKKNLPVVPDLGEFARNRREISIEVAKKYGGKHVAWELSGTRILAAGESLQDVEQKLRRQGLEPSDAVFDFIDPHDQAWIG